MRSRHRCSVPGTYTRSSPLGVVSAAMRPIEPSGKTIDRPTGSRVSGSSRVIVVPPWPSRRRSLVTRVPSVSASRPLWDRSAGSSRSTTIDKSSGSSRCRKLPLTDRIEPLAWARIAPHHTCSPHARSGETTIASRVSGSIRSTHPCGGGPEKAGRVPPRYHCPGSRSITMTCHLSSWRAVTWAVPEAASRRPMLDFWRRLPPHSTGHDERQ